MAGSKMSRDDRLERDRDVQCTTFESVPDWNKSDVKSYVSLNNRFTHALSAALKIGNRKLSNLFRG
jgi:hypothetical protein